MSPCKPDSYDYFILTKQLSNPKLFIGVHESIFLNIFVFIKSWTTDFCKFGIPKVFYLSYLAR